MAENDAFEENVRCWICPGCGFTFSAEHTDMSDGVNTGEYTCPLCEVNGLREELVDLLFAEAELARTSPNGQHPKITIQTHAAALRFAADLVRSTER